MRNERSGDANETENGSGHQAAGHDGNMQTSESDVRQNDAVEDTEDGQTKESGSGDSEDDVIRVSQTPTSEALLTQLEHNRIDSEARGLGAGHTGSAVFHAQRLTALALVPLSVWFVVGVIRMTMGTHVQAVEWLSTPAQAVLMAIFIIVGLRHAVIGIRIVLEDYVRAEPWHSGCVYAVQGAAILIGAASLVTLIHLAM